MSQALLDAKLPYGLSIQLAMESRERLRELEDCDFFIMAHKGVCAGREIGPLIDANQELVRRRAGEIRDLITEPMDFSQICRAVCTRFSLLTRRPRRALYYERNIRLFVEYLMDQGELGMETRQGRPSTCHQRKYEDSITGPRRYSISGPGKFCADR